MTWHKWIFRFLLTGPVRSITEEKTAMKIKTNNRWRMFSLIYSVPEKVQTEYLEYTPGKDLQDGWIKYNSQWYHVSDFLRTEDGGELEELGWHGIYGLCAFCAIVISLQASDSELYKIGYLTS